VNHPIFSTAGLRDAPVQFAAVSCDGSKRFVSCRELLPLFVQFRTSVRGLRDRRGGERHCVRNGDRNCLERYEAAFLISLTGTDYPPS
jgi:hypothetical protein